MPSDRPFLSTIIPVYNGAAFLPQVIENIRHQNYEPLEIIIIDDGSTDETGQIVTSLGGDILYVYQPNAGPAAARNCGIKLAAGEVIAFQDVDDLWPHYKLLKQVDYFMAQPAEVEIVQGLIQDMVLESTQPGQQFSFQVVNEPYYNVNLGSALYRRTVFEKVGLFDETLPWHEDTDWFIRAWEKNIQKVLQEEVVLFYRKHTRSRTHSVPTQAGLVRLYKKRLDRRRAEDHQAPSPGSLREFTHYVGWKP